MFDDRFEVFVCDTDFGISINKQIRYRVFCLERGFEDPRQHPLGEEGDQWDAHAAHFIVREKRSGRWVAATRLIRPEGGSLPVELLDSFAPGFFNGMPRHQIGEISRFCIISKNVATTSQFAHVSRPHMDWIGSVDSNQQFEITLGMLRAMFYYAIKHELLYSYMLITRPFARLLKRLGVQMYQSGEMTEHRGMRAPFLVNMRESNATVIRRSPRIQQMSARKHLAYKSMSELQHSYLEQLQQELAECSECRLN